MHCESNIGQDPHTYDHGQQGAFQLDRGTWEGYFLRAYGWTWEQVAYEPVTHAQAAFEVYERSGRGAWPVCGK